MASPKKWFLDVFSGRNAWFVSCCGLRVQSCFGINIAFCLHPILVSNSKKSRHLLLRGYAFDCFTPHPPSQSSFAPFCERKLRKSCSEGISPTVYNYNPLVQFFWAGYIIAKNPKSLLTYNGGAIVHNHRRSSAKDLSDSWHVVSRRKAPCDSVE